MHFSLSLSLVSKAESYVRHLFQDDASGHDWHHVDRVRRLAFRLAEAEGADRLIVELAALLHDVGDHKFHGGDLSEGPRQVRAWLQDQGAAGEVIEAVIGVVVSVSFNGAGVDTPVPSLEAAVVQDADRLDALGAVGIARTFAFGGYRGQAMHDPASQPEQHDNFEAYRLRAGTGTTINHFYEKLLLLKDRMQTEAGRALAADRHRFMEQYLDTFFREWKGEA